MPILEITVILKEGEILSDSLAPALADAASSVLGASRGRTWVRLSSIQPGMYAEDGGGPPEGIAPVFVSVLKAKQADQETLAAEARTLAKEVAALTGRPPENVHIFYEAPGLGRVAFGGDLLVG